MAAPFDAWVSIFCPIADPTAATRTMEANRACFFMSLLLFRLGVGSRRPRQQGLPDAGLVNGLSRLDFGALHRLGENHHPVADHAPARLNRERPDPLDDDRLALATVVLEHFAFRADLQLKDLALLDLDVGAGAGIEQEDAAFRVDPHLAIAQLRDAHHNRTPPGSRDDLVDDLLRKRIEDD